MVATSPLSAEKKRADHPVLCGDGGWRKVHTHFMVHAACTGAAQLLSIVVRQTVSHTNEIYTDILRIANSCGYFANWCVRTFIRTYVHVQKVWHLKKKAK